MSEAARNSPRGFELDLPAAHSAERKAREVLAKFARGERLPAREIETLEFVASEMLSNAVDHGGGGGTREEADLKSRVRMTMSFSVEGDTWTLRVADQGGGDPRDLRALIDDDEMPDLEDERGRGFFLLRGMLDRLDVAKSRDGLGLEFIAVKTFAR